VLKDLGALRIALTRSVYDPSDDSFLALEKISEFARGGSLATAADIGCGSGILCALLAKRGFISVCIDVSPCAAQCCAETSRMCGVDALVDVVQCDSGECLRSRAIDVAVSNPPYLPIEGDEGFVWDSGGAKGIEIPLRFLKNMLRSCKRECTVLMIVSSLQRYEVLVNLLAKSCREVVLSWERSFFFERLGCLVGRGCEPWIELR